MISVRMLSPVIVFPLAPFPWPGGLDTSDILLHSVVIVVGCQRRLGFVLGDHNRRHVDGEEESLAALAFNPAHVP